MAIQVTPLVLDDAAACASVDAFVASHPAGTAFHRTAWSNAVRLGMGHQAVTLVARQGSEIVGVLPLSQVKSRLFGHALISQAFAVYGGPLALDAEAEAALDAAGWALAERLGAPVLEYRTVIADRAGWATKAETYATFRRNLKLTPDENLLAIPRKQRAEVRKSLEKNLTVVIDRDAARHHRVYAESVRNLGTPVFPRRWFEALLTAYGPDADILTVMHEGAPVASVLSLYDRGVVLPYYGGGVAAARELRANDHMYFKLMEHAVARGCTRFDFGRSKVGTGAYSFKKNWGFEPEPLAYQYKLKPGQALPDINPKNPKYEAMVAIWQRLPLPVANFLGPVVARSLA
jgi:FemAB-related protein (PEP-CTERM system-associated)